MSIRAILVDDEAPNLENLRILLKKHCPQVEILGTAMNKATALEAISLHQPNVLFLDVEMPGHNGFEILEAIGTERNFEVIFVTAFHQYAIDAIRFSALDYLLKPLRVEELIKAVEKLSQKREEAQRKEQMENMIANLKRNHQDKKIAITSADRIDFIKLAEILYCQSDNNYTIFHLKNGRKLMASQTLKTYERLLRDFDFFRVHQSYLINTKYINSILRKEGGHVLMQNGDSLPISRMKKDALMEILT
ncbi:MAG: LytTR family DNA-binding domain-containing protein [Bacteroidota bacterium]